MVRRILSPPAAIQDMETFFLETHAVPSLGILQAGCKASKSVLRAHGRHALRGDCGLVAELEVSDWTNTCNAKA